MNTEIIGLGILDYVIFITYAVVIIGIGLWVSRTKKGQTKTTEDYFLAGKSLPWWAIGASIIAANISAEQFIGMSGSGFSIGLAISAYEWIAAIGLVVVAKFILPIFLKEGIYTIPEFVEKRYNKSLKTILAIFWIGLFVFVNLTSVLYLGALALETILNVPMMYAIAGLSIFAIVYSVYGGLSAVAWTDVVQVFVLILGGFLTAFLAIDYIGGEQGFFSGLGQLTQAAPEHFEMILSKDHPQFENLPGIAVLLGGLWVANLYYFGFNQYIIQRALAAKSTNEAQKGLVFAAFIKFLLPIIVVIPGIAAYVIVNDPALLAGLGEYATFNLPSFEQADKAYPWLAQFLPAGIKGLVFAALTAAIVSSLASMLNSIATIFTMDIYKEYIAPKASQKVLVNVGRFSAIISLIIASFIAPLLKNLGQAFQYIQEYTGLVSPGILAVFLLGIYWKKATSKGAIWGVVLSIPFALFLKLMPFGMPFLDQMLYTFLFTIVCIFVVSLTNNTGDDDPKAIILTAKEFKTSAAFNISSYAIFIIFAMLYAVFW
ncbi:MULTISPECIES: sodium/sugar symporter [Providencia]|uniref:sodium/sugar symporter n=1 Tax=Providencia TaxID=586 RepID=UPI001C834BC0|nr:MULTISPECIES: sodium/sugar symporter [Providencia]MBX6968203.1 sodium/glucose cotransporter [Providencia rettgeri]MBX6978052.1 sodium/glucose cotransporter [Providencia rettgeri]MBX6994933.1 sodium/glucose cotransporter [Providencia rettgeri]MBX6996068.1 sodium/glucose cotransporter [Providencia rettgeri]MBX7023386.1 sodium/glucose cotransporter [Providencia rettgeri]